MSTPYAKRFKAVFFCLHPKGPKMSISAEARYLRKSDQFSRKLITWYSETKMVDDLPGQGSRRSTTKPEDMVIVWIFEQNPQRLLKWKGISISLMTIKPRLIAYGYRYSSTATKTFLSESHIEKCLTCNDFSNVVFTDEASFWASNNHKRAWSIQEKPRIQHTVKHPTKGHIWACCSKQGFGRGKQENGTTTLDWPHSHLIWIRLKMRILSWSSRFVKTCKKY